MATQRSRKANGAQVQQVREASPSPTYRDRQRAMRPKSMSMVPSVMQSMYNTAAESSQPSPTSGRRSPPSNQVYPSPPSPFPPRQQQQQQQQDHLYQQLHQQTPSPQVIDTAYPQPKNEAVHQQFLAKFRALDANVQFTNKLLADLERQGNNVNNNQASDASAGGEPRHTQPSQESPRTSRDFHPGAAANGNNPSNYQTADIPSPSYLNSANDKPSQPYVAASAPASRQPRPPPIRPPTSPSPRHPATMKSPRSPVRSLPVQEEPEDSDLLPERKPLPGSPTPSSDLNPLSEAGDTNEKGDEEDSGSASDSYTPKSPASPLPGAHYHDQIAQYLNSLGGGASRGRGGPSDHLGLQGLDAALLDFTNRAPPPPPPIPYTPDPRPFSAVTVNSTDGDYNPALAYIQAYLTASNSPRPPTSIANGRPNAPIPPTPSTASSPFVATPFSPVPPPVISGSPYPFPYAHIRRNFANATPGDPVPEESSTNGGENGLGGGGSAYDPAALHASLVRQWQIYAQNNYNNWVYENELANGGPDSDSTLSPAPSRQQQLQNDGRFTGWAKWHTSKLLGSRAMGDEVNSMRSSPSHEPVDVRPPSDVMMRRDHHHFHPNRNTNGGVTGAKRKPPPRVESTQPRETSPEPMSSGEETSVLGDEPHFAFVELPTQNGVRVQNGVVAQDIEGEGEWIDEDEEEEDVLGMEYHPHFVRNREKRRRRWEIGWEGLIQAFKTLDRQTDATMILLASPSHLPSSSRMQHHILTSRSIRRSPTSDLGSIKKGFSSLAAKRRLSRSPLTLPPPAPTRDDEVKKVLESLEWLKKFYEEREIKWKEDMKKVLREREEAEEKLQVILREKNAKEGEE